MRQSNPELLFAAVSKGLAIAGEMQVEWVKLLPEENLQKLHELTKKGVRVGVLIVNGAPPRVQFVAVDQAGGFVLLEEVKCTVEPRH